MILVRQDKTLKFISCFIKKKIYAFVIVPELTQTQFNNLLIDRLIKNNNNFIIAPLNIET